MREVRTGIPAVVAAVSALTMSGCTLQAPTAGAPPTSARATAPTAPDDADDGTAVLTYAAWNDASLELGASGLVDGTLDASLECEFEFLHGDDRVTRTSKPEPGPSSLDCGTVFVPIDELTAGVWSVGLVYGLSRSEAQYVEVP